MSIYNCHKQQPQPWMSYISDKNICYTEKCCPALVTNFADTDTIQVGLYGYLYNSFAANNVANIANTGWHVPTQAEFQTLSTYLGGNAASGGALKDTGLYYWNSPNVGATNSSEFNARGAGRRTDTGVFDAFKTNSFMWTSTVSGATSHYVFNIGSSVVNVVFITTWDIYGQSVRLIKDATILINGEHGTYTGNDGKTYETICIGTHEWLVENLIETQYRDHTLIPEVIGAGAWAALGTGARVSYDNDEAYAFEMRSGVTLLPFQIISLGSFIKMEVSVYGANDYQEITIPYTEVYIGGFYFISYNGVALSEVLECGAYDFKLTAGETWYFEPITVKDFTITENAYTIRDDLMLPFKFSEQQFETSPIIAPCDSFLPFMFSTENATSGTIAVYLYDVVADCVVTELTDIIVTVLTISGKTYYIHEGDCFYPFLECGIYKLEIVDGTHSYFSVPFDAVCDMNDIPDGYRVMLDFNRCVMRDEDGVILYEECSDIPEPEPPIEDIGYGLLYNWYAVTDPRNITAAGWHIPTNAESQIMNALLGYATISGGKMKEVGLVHWNSPNTGATNEVGFNLRGGGYRDETGAFAAIKIDAEIWTSTEDPFDTTKGYIFGATYTNDDGRFGYNGKKERGENLRPIKDVTVLTHGQTGTYTGNDGKVYQTICIGTQEYLSCNLAETKYRNGDNIPEVTNAAAWAALATGALCAYNNDWLNV